MLVNTIVVGSSTLALLNCLFSNSSLIINSLRRPPIYSKIENLSELKLWTEIYWILFLQNKILTHGVKSINLFRNKIETVHENNTKNIWEFNKLYLGSCEQVSSCGFDILRESCSIEVRDYFAVKRGTIHNFEELPSAGDLVNRVIFYLSPRIDGNKDRKDVVTISYLKEENLYDFDYSDTIARFKLEKIMNTTLGLEKKVKIKHLRRETVEPDEFTLHKPPPKVKTLPVTDMKKLYDRYKSEYTK